LDGYSHTACIKAGGYTIAILGCGIDICYPKEHNTLMQAIIENGAVISEYPPGVLPYQNNFPKRNRLISAWCKNLLVVEASIESGALITATYAKEQSRQVFALPSSIYLREGIGTNKLIEAGARIYLNPSQLLEGFHLQRKQECDMIKYNKLDWNPLEKIIIDKIRSKDITLNQLLEELKEYKKDILEIVCIMELEGKITIVGSGLRCLIPLITI
jgi:DNA processing protein